MNLELIISGAIQTIVPKQEITLNLFNFSGANLSGVVTSNYTQVPNLLAQVELENNQTLVHKDYYQQNKIYKRFYIQSTTLTGLNRNINTAGDYIIVNSTNLYYKIVEVKDNFEVGWIEVVGCESTDESTG